MDPVERFQTLLESLFQFDASDLDFGIYRILNFKRDQIRKFIHEDLKDTVEKVFAVHKDERLDNIGLQLEDAKQKVIQTLGAAAILATGELKDDFKGTPVGRDYLAIKAQKEEAETIDEIKLQVFNDLYNFFARYYEEGDFVPQYRYSIKNHKYAIPYNGEEVKLYWANCDQYYTKTGILFRDYAFFTDAGKTFKIIFRIVTAKEELGSNKATKARLFVLDDDTPWEMKDGKTLIIRLQYRELNSGEVKKYGIEGGSNTSKQEKINGKIHEAVIEGMKDANLKASLGGPYKNDKPLLLYQLGRFSAKNTKDYFIHKNLKRFLSEQLDYFIKAEVISLETLEKERFFDKHITRAKVVREIGETIIDFLAQIEDFQKKLWEKKKFVLKTEYVITSDLVPEDLHAEVLKNKSQIQEWKELGFEGTKSKAELNDKKLPIDTKHFPEEFKERLLERLTENSDLDNLLDGLLIKSENWQALNLLQARYRGQIKCIYVDPPYNTGSDGFLYKDSYQHANWLSLQSDRFSCGHSLLSGNALTFVSIDDHEVTNMTAMMKVIFGERNFVEQIIWKKRSTPPNDQVIGANHEYVVVFATNLYLAEMNLRTRSEAQKSRYKNPDNHPKGPWTAGDLMANVKGGRYVSSLYFPIINPQTGEEHYPSSNGNWRFSRKTIEKLFANNEIYFGEDNRGRPKLKRFLCDVKKGITYPTIWDFVPLNTEGSQEMAELFNDMKAFENPKPTGLIVELAKLGSGPGHIILDFFAGSGTTAHAVINLNREDGGNRKYILVEMANYFETVLMPRIKKVVYSDEWKSGKPQNINGICHFIKYQCLEQYEDSLDNLELAPDKTAPKLFGDDYLLKYFLDFETRDNSSLLNIEHLKKPFSYKLKVNLEEVGEPQEVVVDISETFHYLLGLKVNKVKVRKNKGKKYLFTFGEKDGRAIAIVWREYDDDWTEVDFKRDKDFIIEELGSWSPQVVYVNGQSVLTPTFGDHVVELRSIEPEFKALMVNSL